MNEKPTTDKIINFMLYILGLTFNLALMAVVGLLVWTALNYGRERGSYIAAGMIAQGEEREIEFILPVDTPAAEVARRLEELGIINNSLLFRAELFLFNRPSEYRAGTFILNTGMSNSEVHRALTGRRTDQAPYEVIRIPEGWTLRDMAVYFEYRGFFTAEEFLYVAQYGVFNFSFFRDIPDDRPNRLEGYLFPDTYQVPLNPTPGQIITRMLRQFENIFDAGMHYRAEEMGLSVDEVVIMASIIERETRLAHERPMVSQVIHRRLAIGMNLEMCSTVAYVLDIPRARLLYVDLLIDSPFNTYMHPGLPIGPISNPGEAALRAVLWPSETDYLFFVLQNPETGAHFFSRTYAEHRAATARYLG